MKRELNKPMERSDFIEHQKKYEETKRAYG